MPPIRIYVMRPLGSIGPSRVSVNGSEGESFADKGAAVRAARNMARGLGGDGQVVEIRQESLGGEWMKILL